jgi:DNA-directed RNA polymerase subunit beta'
MALEAKEVETLSPIRLRYTGKVLDMTTAYDDQDLTHTEPVDFNKEYISTTVGRVILNDALPEGMPFVNGLLKKKGIGQLVNYCNQNLGLEVTVGMLDRIKSLGFQYATRSGLSVGLDDMVIPDSKYTVWTRPTRR